MSKAPLALLALLAVAAGLMPAGGALGGVERPQAAGAGQDASSHPATVPAPAQSPSQDKIRDPSSYIAGDDQQQSAVFARLRPAERDLSIDFDQAAAMLNQRTFNQKIFNKDFENKMRGEYAGRVSPLEKKVNDPLWRPSYYQEQALENSKHDLAQWTTREVMEDQLKDFFNGGDQDSGAMKAVHTARMLTGGEDEKPAEPQLSPEEKAARAHRMDLPVATSDQEEQIPTKLKTKVNVLRQNGSVVFTNPVATTSLNGNRDDFSLNMNRNIRKLALSTNASYALKQECLDVNVNKQITDHVSLNLDHYTFTGDKRGSSGEKSREQARVNYSIGF
jgi:hypothetical protein